MTDTTLLHDDMSDKTNSMVSLFLVEGMPIHDLFAAAFTTVMTYSPSPSSINLKRIPALGVPSGTAMDP
jgi:hypothetical protein